MKRTLWSSVIASMVLVMGPMATAPAHATSVTTDLAVVSVKVTDITTPGATVAQPGDKLKFVPVVKNFGPDVADITVSSSEAIHVCLSSPYFVVETADRRCLYSGVPSGTKFNAMKAKPDAPASGSVDVTFCVTPTTGQIDPLGSNDC